MREYGKVQTGFWEHPGVRRLSTEAKLLYVYLLTGPHTNMAGCFKAPIGYIADDLGWVSDTVSKGFAELSAEGFATFDADSRFVLIHGFLKHNQIANPKMAIGMMKWFREVPEDSLLKPMLAAEVIEHVSHLPNDLATEAGRFTIPSPKPYAERYVKPENREQGTEDNGTSSLLAKQGDPIAANDAGPSTELALVPPTPVRPAKARGARFVPADWKPNAAHIAKAGALGVELAQQVELFRNHEYAVPKTDFDRAFHTWLQNAAGRFASRPVPRGRDQGWDPMQQAIDGMDFNRDDAA